MRVRVLYHDHCFDGAASAAYFSRFYGESTLQAPISNSPAWLTKRPSSLRTGFSMAM